MLGVLALLFLGVQTANAQVNEPDQYTLTDTVSTFENLLERATEGNLAIKKLEVQLAKVYEEQKSNKSFGATQVDYSGGQINSAVYDNQLNVNQDISPLLQNGKWNKLADNQLQLLRNEKSLLLNNLKYELYKEYIYWQFADAQHSYYLKLEDQLKNLLPVIESRYANGEIDAMDWIFAKNELAKLQARILAAQTQKMKREQAIYSIAFLPSGTALESVPFERHLEPIVQFDSSSYQQFYATKSDAILNAASLHKKLNNTPSISAGYFHQSLENEFGFQGLNLGIAIPIDRSRANAAKAIGELEKNVVLQEQAQQVQDFNLILLQEKQKRKILAKSELIYTPTFLSENQKNILRLNSKLAEGEIDAATYGLYLQNIINTEINYLEWVLQCNLNQIEINYHTQLK